MFNLEKKKMNVCLFIFIDSNFQGLRKTCILWSWIFDLVDMPKSVVKPLEKLYFTHLNYFTKVCIPWIIKNLQYFTVPCSHYKLYWSIDILTLIKVFKIIINAWFFVNGKSHIHGLEFDIFKDESRWLIFWLKC